MQLSLALCSAACIALSESSRDAVITGIMDFVCPRSRFPILIISYDTFRIHADRLYKCKGVCDLLICDEAHRLKNEKTITNRVDSTQPMLLGLTGVGVVAQCTRLPSEVCAAPQSVLCRQVAERCTVPPHPATGFCCLVLRCRMIWRSFTRWHLSATPTCLVRHTAMYRHQ